jgi:hypothetical protein
VEWIHGALRRAQAKYPRPEGYPGDVFFKTHFECSPAHPFIERTQGAVCLIRNPRDVLLSGMNFNELTGTVENESAAGASGDAAAEAERAYALSFIEHGGDPAWTRSGYGTWAGHARSWLSTGDFPVLRVVYEELKADPENELARILEFLGIPIDRHRIRTAVEHCSLGRLRNLEVASRAMTEISSLKKAGRYFFNKGLSGQSLAGLGADVEEAFERAFGADAAKLGYPPR